MRLKTLFKQFIQDERGQSTTEYILILAIVVMIAMRFKEIIEDKIRTATEKVGSGIDGVLEDI